MTGGERFLLSDIGKAFEDKIQERIENENKLERLDMKATDITSQIWKKKGYIEGLTHALGILKKMEDPNERKDE